MIQVRTFLAGLLLYVAALIGIGIMGAGYAQNPGTGPVVFGAGQFGPPFSAVNGHFGLGGGPSPSLNAACGTAPVAPAGTDASFFFTSGTSSNSGCRATFATALRNRPICSVDAQSGSQPSFVPDAGGITISGVADGVTYNVLCFNQPGG